MAKKQQKPLQKLGLRELCRRLDTDVLVYKLANDGPRQQIMWRTSEKPS